MPSVAGFELAEGNSWGRDEGGAGEKKHKKRCFAARAERSGRKRGSHSASHLTSIGVAGLIVSERQNTNQTKAQKVTAWGGCAKRNVFQVTGRAQDDKLSLTGKTPPLTRIHSTT